MNDRDLVLLLALLAMTAGDGPSNGIEDGNILSRFTKRATGVVVDAVEPDDILDKVDINSLLERIDVNELLDRVEPDALLDRVDVNRLLDRVDVNQLMDRVDVNALMDRVDIDSIMERAGIADIVRESTGALAGSAIDVFRRQLVSLDTIIGRFFYGLVGRDPKTRPEAPADLGAASGIDETGRGQITGHYAGPVTRLLAFGIDVAVLWFGFLMILAGIRLVVDIFADVEGDSAMAGLITFALFLIWSYLYLWISYTIASKTVGMGVVGIRVVNRQGEVLGSGQSALRTIVLPISAGFFLIGCIGILISPERRTLHDAAAGSVVVYDWGDRPAEMSAPITRWIAKREEAIEEEEVGRESG